MSEERPGPALNKNILVIDDDLELCHVIVDTLKEKGYGATFVQSAEEAFEKASQQPPDLILLDLEIPQMGGFVLCQKFRSHALTKDIPIIFLTVRDSDFDKRTAMSLGASRYITKPFRRSHLLKELESLLSETRSDWIGPSPTHQSKAPAAVPAPPEVKKATAPATPTAPAAAPPASAPAPARETPKSEPPKADNAVKKEATPAAPAAKKPEEPAKPAPAPAVPTAAKGFESFTTFRGSVPQPAGPKQSWKEKLGKLKAWAAANKKISLPVAGALALLLIGGSVFTARKMIAAKKQGQAQGEGEKSMVAVNVMKVVPAPFQDILSEVGTISGGAEIELRFQTEGKVSALKVNEGDKVRSGQVLAQLDQTQTQIKVERARSEYYRYEKLYALGGVSKDRLDEAKVQLDFAQSEMDKTVLKASQDGIFGDKGIEVGEFVTPQKKVGTLVSLNSVILRIGVIEKEIDKLFPGQQVMATVDTYPDMEFKGKVENISPLVQGQSKTLTVEARIPNENKLLLPGMFARAKIIIYQKDQVMAVPNDALEKAQDGYRIFVVGANNTAEQRTVQVSYVSLTHSVISQGLQPGDQVIIQKPQELKVGSPLKVIDVEKPQEPGAPGAAAPDQGSGQD